MKKILITGGAGYIGSVLTKLLLEKNFDVTVIDNFLYGQNSLLDCCHYKNFDVIRGDYRERKILSDALKGIDYIIHLAALVGAPLCEYNRIDAKSTNLDGVKLLLSLRKKSQKIIFPCTNSGYGIGQKDKFCTENTPLRPISYYGKIKVEAEILILKAKNSISFRLATVFGTSPRMRLDLLVNDFVYRAINDRIVVIFEGHFKRNYIHVRDVANAFLHGINNFQKMKNQAYNVGLSKANLSKIELCKEIKKCVPSFNYIESHIDKDPDKRNYIVSNEKIEKTGFLPKYSLIDGIDELSKTFSILKNSKYSNI